MSDSFEGQREQARSILEEAAVEAAQVMVDTMETAPKAGDRFKAAERILQETGVIDRGNAIEGGMPSGDVVKLIEHIGKMFGVSKIGDGVKVEKDVTPQDVEKSGGTLGNSLVEKIREDR